LSSALQTAANGRKLNRRGGRPTDRRVGFCFTFRLPPQWKNPEEGERGRVLGIRHPPAAAGRLGHGEEQAGDSYFAFSPLSK
jgi:hypothetical protein